LAGIARGEWERLSAELKSIGLLTVVDRAALETYCVAYQRWREAEDALVESGGPVIENRSKDPIVNPAFTIAHKSMEILRRIATEFGFTPSSRSRISIKEKNEDPDEDFFGAGKKTPSPRQVVRQYREGHA
jgi:P27 family predicted phage terminase small subunit